MAYVQPTLDASQPPQTQKVKLGATRIRELTAAIRERLASIFVNPDTDPLALKPNSVGLSQLTVAARAGLLSMELIEYLPAFNIPPSGSMLSAVVLGHSVDQLAMFPYVKAIGLGTIQSLNLLAYGVGNNVNISIKNTDSVAANNLTVTKIGVAILTPPP